jgi:AraC-like DNA-binding protein
MKLQLERILPDSGSSFRVLLTPKLNDIYFWHFHPEIEIVYVEAAKGPQHIGEHISSYEGSDLVLIGSYIPHLNFDYGVRGSAETVVVQLKQDFYENGLAKIPEFQQIGNLFEKAKKGISFSGETKKIVGELLKNFSTKSKFEQYLELLNIFQILAKSREFEVLNARPISHTNLLKHQDRMFQIYQFVDENFSKPIDTAEIAEKVNLSLPAFCRYFKKTTQLTYTEFVNQYRITEAKKLLIQGYLVSEVCFEVGFENLAYFNRVFNKITGENPSKFKKSLSTNKNTQWDSYQIERI